MTWPEYIIVKHYEYLDEWEIHEHKGDGVYGPAVASAKSERGAHAVRLAMEAN